MTRHTFPHFHPYDFTVCHPTFQKPQLEFGHFGYVRGYIYWAYIAVYCSIVMCLLLSDFNQNRCMPTNFRNIPNMKFHDDQCGGRCAVLCGRSNGRDKTDSRVLELLC